MSDTATIDAVERTVQIGVMTYRNEHGRTVYERMGRTVRVHPDDVEHFDKFNVPPKIRPLLDPMPGIEDVQRDPTAAERRIMEGFGDRPITAEAQLIALGMAEQEADAETEREIQRRVEQELQRRLAQQDAEPAQAAPARNRRG